MASGGPSVNQGDLQQEEGVGLDSTQVEQVERGVGDDIETESLRVELQHYISCFPTSICIVAFPFPTSLNLNTC